MRFNRRPDRRQCTSDEPTGSIKTIISDAAGIAGKRGAPFQPLPGTWHLKATARGALASHPRAHQDHTHHKGARKCCVAVKFLLGASFERACAFFCEIIGISHGTEMQTATSSAPGWILRPQNTTTHPFLRDLAWNWHVGCALRSSFRSLAGPRARGPPLAAAAGLAALRGGLLSAQGASKGFVGGFAVSVFKGYPCNERTRPRRGGAAPREKWWQNACSAF